MFAPVSIRLIRQINYLKNNSIATDREIIPVLASTCTCSLFVHDNNSLTSDFSAVGVEIIVGIGI